jgi:hypothetical protein
MAPVTTIAFTPVGGLVGLFTAISALVSTSSSTDFQVPITITCKQVPADAGTNLKALFETTDIAIVPPIVAISPLTAVQTFLTTTYTLKFDTPNRFNYYQNYFPLVSSYDYADGNSGYQGLTFGMEINGTPMTLPAIQFYSFHMNFAQREADEVRINAKRHETGDPQWY